MLLMVGSRAPGAALSPMCEPASYSHVGGTRADEADGGADLQLIPPRLDASVPWRGNSP